jgi:L-seryl-tRNA(Ser) seleniumtransferase
VGVGDFLRCLPWELESAINENTAAIAYLVAPFVAPYAMPLPEVAEIAHAHKLPVIVDAASMVPPRENLTRYINEGADMVIFSGGKAIRGPQGTGILAGRKDLIEAARANGSPNQFIGRGMKVTKEEVVGLVEALNTFVTEDEDAENAAFRAKSQRVVDALIEMPGLDVEVRHNKKDWLIPSAVIRFTDDWAGPSRENVLKGMENGGDTKIFLHWLAGPDTLAVDPLNLDDDEVEVVISRLREELLRNE